MIIAGERRFRAHQLINAPTVRCIVDDTISDVQVMIEAIVENGQRVNVHPLEEAVAYQAVLDAGVTAEQLAVRVWSGDSVLAEYCQHQIVGVLFEDPKP